MAETSSSSVHAVDAVYARALLDLAMEAGQAGDLQAEAAELAELIGKQPELRELLSNRMLSEKDRTGIAQRLFEGKISDLLFRFIRVVSDKGRLDRLHEILLAYQTHYDQTQGVFDVDVYVAQPLEAARADQVAGNVGQALGGTARLRQHVDPKLIGGLKIRVGDRMIDGSVATQLKLIRERIIREGREKARNETAALIEE